MDNDNIIDLTEYCPEPDLDCCEFMEKMSRRRMECGDGKPQLVTNNNRVERKINKLLNGIKYNKLSVEIKHK